MTKLTIPSLSAEGRKRWREKLQGRFHERGEKQSSMAREVKVNETDLSRFVGSQDDALERWFNRSKNAERLEAAMGLEPGALSEWLRECSDGPLQVSWHSAFPGVTLEAAVIDPPVEASRDVRVRTVEQVVAWLRENHDTRQVRVVGSPKSGRSTLAWRLRSKLGAVPETQAIEILDAPPGLNRWVLPGLEQRAVLEVRTAAWGRSEYDGIVERLVAAGALSGERLSRATTFSKQHLAESEGWIGPRRRPVDIIQWVSSVARDDLPDDLGAALRRTAAGEWQRLVRADGQDVVAALPDHFPQAFWAAALRRPAGRAILTLGRAECVELVERIAGFAGPTELRARLEAMVAARTPKDRRALLDELPRWGDTQSAAVVEHLVAAGFLMSVAGDALTAADDEMALLWAALGTECDVRSASLLHERLGSPEMVAIARWWPALGVSLDALLGWLEPCPPMFAFDAGRVLVAFASELTDAHRSRCHASLRRVLVALWAAATWGVAAVPFGALGLHLDDPLIQSFPVVSRKLACFLPPLDPGAPFEGLRALVDPAVAGVLRGWERFRSEVPAGLSPSIAHAMMGLAVPEASLDGLIGGLCPVQVFPRRSMPWQSGVPAAMPRWGDEDFAALEVAARSGDRALAGVLAGDGAPWLREGEWPTMGDCPGDTRGARPDEQQPETPDAEEGPPLLHPWDLLPAEVRLRWLGKGRRTGANELWGRLRVIAQDLRSPVDVDDLVAACERLGPEAVEKRLVRSLDAGPGGSSGWMFPTTTVLELAKRFGLRLLLRRVEDLWRLALEDYRVKRTPGGYVPPRFWILNRTHTESAPGQVWEPLQALDALGQRAAELLFDLGEQEPLRARAADPHRLKAPEALSERLRLEDDLDFGLPMVHLQKLGQVPLTDEEVEAQVAAWRHCISEWEEPWQLLAMFGDPGDRARWLRRELDPRTPHGGGYPLPLHAELPSDNPRSDGLTLRALVLAVAFHDAGARALTPAVRAWIGALPRGRLFGRSPDRGLSRVSVEQADAALRELNALRDKPGVVSALEARVGAERTDTDAVAWDVADWVREIHESFLLALSGSAVAVLQGAARKRALSLGQVWAYSSIAGTELRESVLRHIQKAPDDAVRTVLHGCPAAPEGRDESTLLVAELSRRGSHDAADPVVRQWLAVDDPFRGTVTFGYRDGVVVGGLATRLRLILEHAGRPGHGGALIRALGRWWDATDDAWDAGWRDHSGWVAIGFTPFDEDLQTLAAPSPRYWMARAAQELDARALLDKWATDLVMKWQPAFELPRWWELKGPQPGTPPLELATWWAEHAPVDDVARAAEGHPDELVRLPALERIERDAPAALHRIIVLLYQARPGLLDWAVDMDPWLVERLLVEWHRDAPERRDDIMQIALRLAPRLRYRGVDLSGTLRGWGAAMVLDRR